MEQAEVTSLTGSYGMSLVMGPAPQPASVLAFFGQLFTLNAM